MKTALPINGLTPPEVFECLLQHPGVFWLDSASADSPHSQWSLLGAEPWATFTADATGWRWAPQRQAPETGQTPPLEKLQDLLDRYLPQDLAPTPHGPSPMGAGVVGYFSYDFGLNLEALAQPPGQPILPQIHLAFYQGCYAWHHPSATLWAVGQPAPLSAPCASAPQPLPELHWHMDPSREAYCNAVEQARQYIAAGDIYQVNLAQRFSTAKPPPAPALYARLRQHNAAPFAAYLDLGAVRILSCSPERFLQRAGDTLRTCPIKGTRPRSSVPARDEELRAELANCPKEHAELLMIVDLLRNDLGRVCQPGTVQVVEPGAISSYATVHHRIAEVIGKTRPAARWADIFRATLPGGSVTGTPKYRAMQIIRELEGRPRDVFCGSLGYCATPRHGDWNIAIRTLVHTDAEAWFQAGAGIVWDSDPEAEFHEVQAKANGLRHALSDSS